MKAVRFHEHGGPEVLRVEDAPDPAPRPGWAIVRVRACALNRLDIWQRRGLDRVKIPLPHISGADVAGVVAEVGDGVSGWSAGDRVMLQPGLSCGVYRSLDELSAQWQVERRFMPTMPRARAEALMAQWDHAVRQATLEA